MAAASGTPTRPVPYQNPTPLSNFVEVIFILLISAALTHTFGACVRGERQGWAPLRRHVDHFPRRARCLLLGRGSRQPRNFRRARGRSSSNMEGKEIRFGIFNSAPLGDGDDHSSNGSVNSMYDSFTPLGGIIPLFNLLLGEVIYWRRRLRPLRHFALCYYHCFHRRSHGRAHTGISRQEARGEGSQDGHARHPDPAIVHARLDSRRGRNSLGRGLDQQCRPAWLFTDTLRLYLANREQRLSLCRTNGKYSLVQCDRRIGDVDRTLFLFHPGHGDCRFAP